MQSSTPDRPDALFAGLIRAVTPPPIAIGVAVASVATFAYAWLYYPVSQGHTGDFLFMLSHRDIGRGWWDGRGVGYGPVFALYDLFLRGVSDLTALRIMFVANLGMLLATFVVAVRTFLPGPRTREEILTAAFAFVSFYPTIQALRQDNVEITEVFCLVMMLAALRVDREILAGMFLGIAGATKILPFALVAYFVWRRRYRVAASAIVAGFVLLSMVIALKGETLAIAVDDWHSHAGLPFPYEFQNNQAMSGFWYRLFSTFDLSTRWGVEHPVVRDAHAAHIATYVASAIFCAIVAGLVLHRTGVFPRGPAPRTLEGVEIALVLTSMLVVLPHTHTHYFVLIAWAYLPALREWPRPRGRAGAWAVGLLGVSYVLMGMLLYLRLTDPLWSPLGPVTGIDLARLASLPLFGAILAVGGFVLVHRDLCSPRER